MLVSRIAITTNHDRAFCEVAPASCAAGELDLADTLIELNRGSLGALIAEALFSLQKLREEWVQRKCSNLMPRLLWLWTTAIACHARCF